MNLDNLDNMSASGAFVDRIDPWGSKASLKKKKKKSQGSSRYRNAGELELQVLPYLKGKFSHFTSFIPHKLSSMPLEFIFLGDLTLILVALTV